MKKKHNNNKTININRKRYTQNQKTTKSWPVIYRNPHCYDYEQSEQLNGKSAGLLQKPSTQCSHRKRSSDTIVGGTGGGTGYSSDDCYCSYCEDLVITVVDDTTEDDIQMYDNRYSYEKCSNQNLHETSGKLYGNKVHSNQTQSGIKTATATATLTAIASSPCSCTTPSPVTFLFLTLLMTTGATAMLCAAIMTDYWEHVTWDPIKVERLNNHTNSMVKLNWHLNGKVAEFNIKDHGRTEYSFLVPMHGGIWTLCISLSEKETKYLERFGFPNTENCVNYLAESIEHTEELRSEWHQNDYQTTLHPHLRMQNLSISCSLVCLIILGSAALVGAFGVCQRQISAILVTGVMYLLAALFALFTLMIIHFKRQHGRPLQDSDFDGQIDGLVTTRISAAKAAHHLLAARQFITSWSLNFGWGGVILCVITSILWIFLSKIMRHNPFSALFI